MEMKVILRQRVERLGDVGDIVTVKAGYARNYLLPKGIAFTVTKENLRRIQVEKERLLQEEQRKIQSIKVQAEKLSTSSVTIEARAKDGKLFGSVTVQMIVDAIKKQKGIELSPRSIRLDHPLKEIGVYDVPVHLHPEVDTVTKVWVVEARG